MPTLQFKGKNIIWNHHLSVPYHTIEEVSKLHFQPDKSNGNLIIEGDNLLALKALLPLYAGKVKVVCIDPPYNTGNEGWAYNDKVNSPLIKEWLGKEVGKDDLTRHDKWLCMMTPRLRLLWDLLADDGAICVNIDDNELHNLRNVMNEVFDEENFRNFIIIRRGIKSVQAQFDTVDRLNYGAEYVVIYTKNPNHRFKKIELELEQERQGGWNNHWRGTDRPTMRYDLFSIIPKTGQWRWGKERSLRAIENYKEMIWDLNKPEEEITQEEIDNWYLKKLEETGEELDLLRLSSTNKPEHYIPISATKLASSLWSDLKPNGNNQLKQIFGKKVFENPKSIDLIKRLINFIEGDSKDVIILDSFSGSGTTGHAVMDLNKEDGGNRKFILVQMTEATEKEPDKNICKEITRERIKRAIEKYGYDSGFKYLRVGQPLDAETLLEGNLPEYKLFAKYIYYLCTGENLNPPSPPFSKGGKRGISKKDFFVGTFGKQAIYLIYQKDYEKLTKMALNLEIAEKIIAEQPNKKRIVYAPACFLDEEYMEANQIEFVSMPYNLFQRKIG